MSASNAAGVSRYQRFQDALRHAAGDSPSDHGGLGAFWTLPLEQLLNASLYGVRLIAPASQAGGSCCSHNAQAPATTRADRSGLIQGLRGAAPFDGTRFPRLPWGGRAVPAADIEAIAEWIDDGCPASDRELASFDLGTPEPVTIALTRPRVSVAEPAVTRESFAAPAAGANAYLFERGELKQRMNIDCMDDTQLARLRYAMRELYQL